MIDYERTNMCNQKSIQDAEYFLNSINQIAKQYGGITQRQVYNILSKAYPVSGDETKIRQEKQSIVERTCRRIEKIKQKKNNIKTMKIQDQGEYFTHTNVTFKGKEDVGVRDLIKLYIPMQAKKYEKSINKIYKFLLDNEINMQSKVSATARVDNFVVRVSSREDAMKIIEFCNTNKLVSSNLYINNPFVPQLGGIGIARDTYGKSYNSKLAEEIANYINSEGVYRQQVGLADLYSYVNRELSQQSKGSKDSFMTQTIKSSLESIMYNTNPLDNFINNGMKFEYGTYSQYTRQTYSNRPMDYVYISKIDGSIITEQSNYMLYTKLQAMNCMEKLYKYENGYAPQGDFCVSGELLENLSKSCVSVMDENANCVTAVHDIAELSQNNPRIANLYPYLYSQFAIEQFGVNEGIARNINQKARNRILLRKEPEKKKESLLKRIFSRKSKQLALPEVAQNNQKNFKEEYRVDVRTYIPQNQVYNDNLDKEKEDDYQYRA